MEGGRRETAVERKKMVGSLGYMMKEKMVSMEVKKNCVMEPLNRQSHK